MDQQTFQVVLLLIQGIVIPTIGATLTWVVLVGNRLVRVETLIGNGIFKTIEKIEMKCPACTTAVASLDTRLTSIEKQLQRLDQFAVVNERLAKIEQYPVCMSELERIARHVEGNKLAQHDVEHVEQTCKERLDAVKD